MALVYAVQDVGTVKRSLTRALTALGVDREKLRRAAHAETQAR